MSPLAGPLLNPAGSELVTAVYMHYWVSGSSLSMLTQHSRSAVRVVLSVTGSIGNCLFRRALDVVMELSFYNKLLNIM